MTENNEDPYDGVRRVENRRGAHFYKGSKQYHDLLKKADELYPQDIDAQNKYIESLWPSETYDAGAQDVLIALRGTINPEQRKILKVFFKYFRGR